MEEKKFEEIKKKVRDEERAMDPLKAISLDEMFSMKLPESKWVIEKLIPHQGITIISGAPASFKTWVLLRMAIDIAKGESLVGQFKCEKNSVLIIDEENPLRIVRERMYALGAGVKLPIYYLSQKGFLVSKKGMIEDVLAICEEKKIDIIFIDSLVRINNADENDASKMAEVFRGIRRFCQSGKTVIITHHERKEGAFGSSAQNRLRGSSDIQAAVDCHLAIRRDKNEKTKITIEQAKLRSDEEIASFEMAIRKNNNESTEVIYLGLHSEDASKKDLAKEATQVILEEEKDGLPMKEIFQKVKEVKKVGDKNIREAIKELMAEEIIVERKGGGNTKICYLAQFVPDEIAPQKAPA